MKTKTPLPLSVSFILNSHGSLPIGGLRIIYEYASRLSQKSWRVNVVHPARLTLEKLSLFKALLFWAAFFKNSITGSFLPKDWFKINPRVKMLLVPDLREKHIPDADYIVACPVESAFFVTSYGPEKGIKYYFIQHFEDWTISPQEVEKTWKMPLKKIVIAKWLLDKAENLGEKAIYIPNGLDFNSFGVDIPFSKKQPKSILFLSHYLEIKGTGYATDAVKKIKESFPEITVISFGTLERPALLPDFVVYLQNPPQAKLRELYNNSQVFISPSLAEGWPLPPAEAMMCGCLVIATDIGGHREYITDGENGLLCKPKSSESIVEKCIWTFNNSGKAEQIAKKAPESLKKFDWESRVSLFEKALLS